MTFDGRLFSNWLVRLVIPESSVRSAQKDNCLFEGPTNSSFVWDNNLGPHFSLHHDNLLRHRSNAAPARLLDFPAPL